MHLQSEIKEYENSIKSYENSIKSYEEVESDLKKIIVCQKNALDEHEEASANGQTPGFETLTNFEHLMKNKMKEIGKSLDESLLKQVEQNNKQIEEKLNSIINQNQTYEGNC